MWKLLLGFVAFAVVVLVVLKQVGGNVDMGGEKHGIETGGHGAEAASAPAMAPSAAAPASAAASN
jgi:hypothetical protein